VSIVECEKPCYKITQAITGEATEATHTHRLTATGKLSCGSVNIDWLKRERDYSYSLSHNFKRSDPYVVSNDAYPGGGAATSDTYSESKNTTINDSWSIIDCEIIYCDPRNDVLIYRKTTTVVSYQQDTDNINTIPKYSNFAALPININTTIETISSLDGVLETTVRPPYKGTINLTTAAADIFHLLNYYVPEGFYAQNEGATDVLNYEDDSRDGWLMFMPTFISGAFVNKDFDRGLRVAVDSSVASNYPIADESIDSNLAVDDYPQGSWAFDKDGNSFTSQKLTNSNFNKLTVKGTVTNLPKEKVRDRVMDGSTQKVDSNGNLVFTDLKESEHTAWYPMSPV
jgi:hypothetical protein